MILTAYYSNSDVELNGATDKLERFILKNGFSGWVMRVSSLGRLEENGLSRPSNWAGYFGMW